MASNNGASYQRDNLGNINYENNSNDIDTSGGGNKKKLYNLVFGAILVVIVGLLGVEIGKRSDKNIKSQVKMVELKTSEAMSKTLTTDVKKDSKGELKLFDNLNRYVLEDYDSRTTFSSFLPGVAGYFGKPVWVFYVNRGQALATFGTTSKDYPLMEFNPANKAYQLTPYMGFRSFVRAYSGDCEDDCEKLYDYEPFSPANTRNSGKVDNEALPKRVLFVGTNEVEVQEVDGEHDLTTNANYFILPEEDFAAMVRRATYTNTGKKTITVDILDGLAKMEPAGGKLDGLLKNMGRTLEGWFGVYHYNPKTGKSDGDDITMPFYKMSTEPSDEAFVKIELEGHYCLSFIEHANKTSELLPIVYDTAKVFGQSTSLDHPSGLLASSVEEIVNGKQYGYAQTSSAFAAVSKLTLKPGESVTIDSVYGKAKTISQLAHIKEVITKPNFIQTKFKRARSLIDDLTSGVATKTVNNLFDGAVKQMYLDNSLRGGLPTVLGNVNANTNYDEDPAVKIFHSFSRIHGDLERDYNAFKIEPAFFSQGPGNYRDIAQNRRDDVVFTPRLASFDIQMFLSFIQADGYEPLTVEAVVYIFPDKEKAKQVARHVTGDHKSEKVLTDVLSGGPFRPGQLFDLIKQLNITITVTNEEFVNTVLAQAEDRAMAVYGTGYWADHWDYYIDMIESYLSIYPDGEEKLMYDNELRYFFSTATVKPRSEKYVEQLTFDGKGKHVLQLDSTYFDGNKAKEQEAFRDQNTGLLGIEASWQRTAEGVTFKSSPIAKLFLLGAIKFAMRDAYGMGVEYEGGRPGWLDSMNGLPGMVGSGMPETYELYLLLKYVKKVVDTYGRDVTVPAELGTMITSITEALDELDATGYLEKEVISELPNDVPDDLFHYWDVVAAARESYRNDVQYYFSGNETTYTAAEVSEHVERWLSQIEIGIERAHHFATKGYGDDGTTGIPACFFSYEITDWKLNEERTTIGLPLANALAMKVGVFPLFLEGPVRYMKTIQDDKEKMSEAYQKVLTSGLRDEELKMYYLSASLEGQGFDMGRQVAFAPGWLENQSIWLHMSYKYYLQLLRGKLYDEFFSEMKNGGILPFMDPKVYGRSLMECSSFIASSAFPDPSVHGKGFLARLSGSTAEFMSIWKLMFIGPNPFYLNSNNELEFTLVPAIPDWLFEDNEGDSTGSAAMYDDEGNHTVKFNLFASIEVTYHNPGGKNLYGVAPKSYKISFNDGTSTTVDGSFVPSELALRIRRVTTVETIDAYF